jgi:hypothetical protein
VRALAIVVSLMGIPSSRRGAAELTDELDERVTVHGRFFGRSGVGIPSG